jgi:membrane protease YdiL (CAAX protease family)
MGQDSKQQLAFDPRPGELFSYYRRELAALCQPATPLFVTAVYCVVVSLWYYYKREVCVVFGTLLSPESLLVKDPFTLCFGLQGLWYLLGPCMAVFVLRAALKGTPKAQASFPLLRLRDFGLRVGAAQGWKDSMCFLGLVLPIVVIASFLEDFSNHYPLSKLACLSVQWFAVWQVIQLFYFFGWEFLNRGVLLMGMETAMGRWSVLAAAVPFCVLHFGKPVLETLISFVVAIGLGWLTLRARSVLPATFLHWGWTCVLDAAIVIQKGGFPE